MTVNLNDVKLSADLESIKREKISDEEYFSSKYSDYISNSRLKLINSEQEGSPSKYQIGFTGEVTSSLSIGSAIHELFLQSDIFSLGPDLGKPSAKLGLVVDIIWELRAKGCSIENSIITACKWVHYYENSLSKPRIRFIIQSGLQYYLNRKNVIDNNVILLSSKDRGIVQSCINNLNSNRQIMNLVNPHDLFGDPITSYNEDAFFINVNATYNDQNCVLKLKMKADNWTIDPFEKIITLNDLKTTGHLISQFMQEGGSMEKFHYNRQFAMYLWMLLRYCEKEYNYNSEEWTVKCNVIVVETTADNHAGVYSVSKELLHQGRKEFCKLLKMVAYCEMNGYSDDIVFI